MRIDRKAKPARGHGNLFMMVRATIAGLLIAWGISLLPSLVAFVVLALGVAHGIATLKAL